MRRRDKAYKKCKKLGRPSDEAKFQRLKREVQRECRQAYWNHIEEIVTPDPDNTSMYCGMKKFWKFIKQQRTDFSGVAPLKVNGTLVNDPLAKAEALNSQFHSVFTSETDPCNLTPPAETTPSMLPITISTAGVLNLLRSLKPGKAPGPDMISSRVLKELADELAEPLADIFQVSLEKGQVPTDWKHANVTPVFKKGQRYDCANYRPISLTCIASKVMEHIIASSMMRHAKYHSLLYDRQHGFREGRSCETQLLEFINDVTNNVQDRQQTDVCILDFSKAFDKVGHKRLVRKLQWYGIDGMVNRWIEDFLQNRHQAVVVDGLKSTNKPVVSGVPQGSVLGPCLFLFYINDIADNLHSTTRLFADDTMLYITVSSQSDADLLQSDLDTLARWESTWMMEFHPGKCEVITVSRGRNPIHYKYTLHGQELNHVDSTKYLGVHITKDLRWDRHIDAIANKANKSLNFLRRNIKIGNPQIKQQAYKALVRPILEYGQTVWDPHTASAAQRLEAVQRRAARFVTNRYRRTSSVTNMIEHLQWEPLTARRHHARLVMFYKIHTERVAIQMPLQSKNRRAPTRNENSPSYVIPSSTTDYHRLSFFPRTVREWNCLPDSTVRMPSVDTFKASLLEPNNMD